MSIFTVNKVFKQQNKRLVNSSFKKGIINAVNSNSHTVDIQYAENPQTIIKNVPLAKNIATSSVTVGLRCAVVVFDETNPADCVVHAIY